MVLARWQATIVDDAGNVVDGASIEVRREVSGAPLASVYSDRAGTTPLGNPFTTGPDGFAAFHVAGGAYRIAATKGAFSRVWHYVAIGTLAEQDADAPSLGNLSLAGYVDQEEIAAPNTPMANDLRRFARDVGGKTQYAAMDSTGTIIDLFRGIVDARDFGAVPGASAAVNTTAIQAAIDWCESLGGGRIRVSRGTYLITNIQAPATSWDDDVALSIEGDNIYIEGDGPGTTVITLANSSNCHVFKLGRRVGSSVAVTDCGVSKLTIDGNRANQSAPTATEDHWQGIDVATGATRVDLKDLHIHDCQHYGIGFQRGTFTDCTVKGVIIEDTGADGIDIKNDSSLNFGNAFENIRIRRFGLAGGLSTDQAGLDIYGGVQAKGITITEFGTSQGKCGIRFQSDSGGFTQSTAAQLENFYIRGDDSSSTQGVRLNNHSGRVSGGQIFNCEDGFLIEQRENAISNVHAESCVNGFVFSDLGGLTATPCERNVLTGCVARSNTGRGFHIAGENQAALIGCVARSNDIGIDIDASSTDALLIGCTADSNTTSQIIDDGTRTTIISASTNKLQGTTTLAGTNAIVGTVTNDNAGAGRVGEIIESSVASGSAVALTTNTATNVTSISLTAGDWDVWGNVFFLPAATTSMTSERGGISQTSATFDGGPAGGAEFRTLHSAVVPNQQVGQPVGRRRISLSATTTIYLVALATFTVSTLAALGYVGARRVR